jgi:aminoglycoside phosphotransferase (APT) family kinase protein
MFDSALIVGRDGRELIIRVPRDQTAETEQSADLVALRALTVGNRSRLPFDVPQYVGQAPVEGTRGVVYELLNGDAFDADALTGHAGVSGSIGRAIAAIHGLPTAFVADAGLPQQSAAECRDAAILVIDRAANTGHLPAALVRRWEQATDDDGLWQFQPCVIHGSLSDESFLVTDDAVSGVLGWSSLAVGDPARDLHWLLSARGEAAETALASYSAARQGGDPRIAQRATLYGELELARWLLHGTDTHNPSIIDDAVAMLDRLVDTVHNHTMHPLSPATGPILEVSDVEAMLKATPRRGLPRDQGAAMQTDSYDLASFAGSEFADSDFPDTKLGEPKSGGSTESRSGNSDRTDTGTIPTSLFADDDGAGGGSRGRTA